MKIMKLQILFIISLRILLVLPNYHFATSEEQYLIIHRKQNAQERE